MIHDSSAPSGDENHTPRINHLDSRRADVLEQTNNMTKLLAKLDCTSPLAVKEKQRGEPLTRVERYPAQAALGTYRTRRDIQAQHRHRKYQAAAELIKEWRSRIMIRLRKKMQAHLVYQYLLKRHGAAVFQSLKPRADRRSLYASVCSSSKERMLRRHWKLLFQKLQIMRASRMLESQFSLRHRAWDLFRKRLVAYGVACKSEYIISAHSVNHFRKTAGMRAIGKLVDFTMRQNFRASFGKRFSFFHTNKLMRRGLAALLLNRIRSVRQNGDLPLRNAAKKKKKKIALIGSGDSARPLKDIVLAAYSTISSFGDLEDEQSRYVSLVNMRRTIRRLRKNTIDLNEKMAIASTVKIIYQFKFVFRRLVTSRLNRRLHRRVIMEKLSSRTSTVVLSKLPEQVVLGCVMRRGITALRNYKNRAVRSRELEHMTEVSRKQAKLRQAMRYLSFWATSRAAGGVSCVVSCSASVSRSSKISKLVPLLPALSSGGGPDHRSVTIVHTPRSALTEFTDLDTSTLFGGGSILRSSLQFADMHYAQYYGGKSLQQWITRTSQRREERKYALSLKQTVENAFSTHSLRMLICWRVYFIFASGRKVASSVIANAILSASGDGQNKKNVAVATDKFTSELVKRFRYMGETHRWLDNLISHADRYWYRFQLGKGFLFLSRGAKKSAAMRRVSAAGNLIKLSLALRRWSQVYVPRSKWINTRMDAAEFVICSRYFRIFMSRVLNTREIGLNSTKGRQERRSKVRSAFHSPYYVRLASFAFSKFKDLVNSRRRDDDERMGIENYYREAILRRGFDHFKQVSEHCLHILRYVSHHHRHSLLLNGVLFLRENVTRRREVQYQYENTEVLAPNFNMQYQLRKAFMCMVERARSHLYKDRDAIFIAENLYVRKYFAQWRSFHALLSGEKYCFYAANKYRRNKLAREVFSTLRRRVGVARIQYGKINFAMGFPFNGNRTIGVDRGEENYSNDENEVHLSEDYYYDSHPEWVEYVSDEGHRYFYNDLTGESVWRSARTSMPLGYQQSQQLLPCHRAGLRHAIKILRHTVSITNHMKTAKWRRKHEIFTRWTQYVAVIKPLARVLETYELKAHNNRKAYLPVFFRRWFLNVYPDRSIEKYGEHHTVYTKRFYWNQWFFRYRNNELLQEEQERAERAAVVSEASLYCDNRMKAATLTQWFNTLAYTLSSETLLKRIEANRDLGLLRLGLNNFKARADDGYERTVIMHRVKSFHFVNCTRKAIDNFYDLSCSRFAEYQRIRIGDYVCRKMQKKRAFRNLLRNAVIEQTHKRRQQLKMNRNSWMREEKKN